MRLLFQNTLMPMRDHRRNRRAGLSLLELLAAVFIMGVLASILIPRLGSGSAEAKKQSCSVNVGVIDVQTALWRRATGKWPSSTLKDIGKDTNYFPEGIPVCPHGQTYQIDSKSGRVIGHTH